MPYAECTAAVISTELSEARASLGHFTMPMLTLGLRIVYDGFRALKINMTEQVETLVDEVYQDTAALRLTPPRRKAIFKPKGMSDTLDMFWDTSESSVSTK